MTASLFYEQKYEWSINEVSELYKIHRPAEYKRARRYVSDISKLSVYKQDELYEFLFFTTCKEKEKLRKDKQLAEWLERLYQRWKRYKGLERDLIKQMIGV